MTIECKMIRKELLRYIHMKKPPDKEETCIRKNMNQI